MEEINDPKITKNQYQPISTLIVVGVLSGMVGGLVGAWYLPQISQIRKLLPVQEENLNLVSKNIVINENSEIIDVVEKASPAVVSVVVSKDLSKIPGYGLSPFEEDFFYRFFEGESQNLEPNVQQIGAGSGFFISEDGMILTNKHVVSDKNASYSVILNDGQKYEAKVLATDPRNDLAILKIEGKGFKFLELSDTSGLKIGQKVVAIGNSLGQYQNTVTTGVISGIGRRITAGSRDGSEQLENVIQTDAAINPGNSGGPLLNLAGQVIGINTAIDSQGQLVGFAIPAGDAKKAVASFEKYQRIVRPYIGVRYVMINKSFAEEEKLPKEYGALIVRGETQQDLAVIPGSPANRAGLVENDIILEVDGKKLEGDYSLAAALRTKEVGDSVTLKIYHQGEEKTVSLKLEESK